jgi:thiol-disulfide isomerase/thioredoxin
MTNSIIALNIPEIQPEPVNLIVFGKIYADWCGHCKILEPEWNKLKEKMANENVLFEEVNSEYQDTELQRINDKYLKNSANKVGLQGGYPTIFCIKKGNVEYYDGKRDIDNMYGWCMTKMDSQPLHNMQNSLETKKPLIHIEDEIIPLDKKILRKTKRNKSSKHKNRFMKKANIKTKMRKSIRRLFRKTKRSMTR